MGRARAAGRCSKHVPRRTVRGLVRPRFGVGFATRGFMRYVPLPRRGRPRRLLCGAALRASTEVSVRTARSGCGRSCLLRLYPIGLPEYGAYWRRRDDAERARGRSLQGAGTRE